MTAQLHARDGKQVPEVEECVEIFAALSESEELYIHQILARPPGRYKGWSKHYVFDGLTTQQADALCAYLRHRVVAHDRETTRRWTP